jgi:hypothetical protein
MASNRFIKRLPLVLKGKMKGTAPSPFVKDGGQIVIGIHERLIRRFALLRGRGIVIVQGGIVVHAVLYRIGTRQAFLLYKKEAEGGEKENAAVIVQRLAKRIREVQGHYERE